MINGFSVGRDISLSVQTSSGTLALDITTSFDSDFIYDERTSKGLDGINRFIPIPAGVKGTFELDRQDADAESFFIGQQASYYNGQPIVASTITVTITNPDGSTSIYLHTGVMLTLEKMGKWQGDDIVKQTVAFRASQLQQLQ